MAIRYIPTGMRVQPALPAAAKRQKIVEAVGALDYPKTAEALDAALEANAVRQRAMRKRGQMTGTPVHVRLSPADLAKLDRLAGEDRVTRQEYLRRLLEAAHG